MKSSLFVLEQQVPPPVKVPFRDQFVFRYTERTIEQALVQKLARVVTGLHSARILLNSGFLQEHAAIQRMLDEFQQDISFLSYARLFNDVTALHARYLDAFYEEEFDDPASLMESTQKRPSIPRQKIRAYIAQKEAEASDPSRGIELRRTLSKAYSGFVHGASPQIMNMYGGNPARFHASGMLGTPHESDHRKDLWNYFYRGLISFDEVAMVFAHPELIEKVRSFLLAFKKTSSKRYSKRAKAEIGQ